MTDDLPRILVIEDDLDTAALVLETLADYFGTGCTTHVDNAADAKAIDTTQFDLVLSDMNLPDGNGLDIMHHLLQQRPDLPIVFVTGENILGNAIQAIRDGAYDYVVKAGDYLFSIPVVVEKNLELWRIKQENEQLQNQLAEKNQQLEQAVERLETVASTDPLTGLANRRSINKAMDDRFAEAGRSGDDLAVLMMDLDGFKGVNDTAGHPVGDQVLVVAAQAIRDNCRQYDVAGRFGGDEFILILPDTSAGEAAAVAERILSDFNGAAEAVCRDADYHDPVSMSAGLATLHETGITSAEMLMAGADRALYAAKDAGKHRLMHYQPPASDAA